jgi:biotin carboxylase
VKKTALVLVEDEVLALKGIYALKNSGYKVSVLTKRKSVALKYCRCVSSFYLLPASISDQALIEKIRSYRTDIIFPADIDSAGQLYKLSLLDSSLPIFPCSAGELLDALDNKSNFISLLENHGIKHPKSVLLVPPFSESDKTVEEIDFPLVAKNLYGECGRGVSFLDSREEFDRFISVQASQDANDSIQLQKFIVGDVFGLNICAVNGVICAWSVYKKLDEDTILFMDRFDICEIISKLISDLKYSGLANFDLIVSKDGVYFIECNPRVWYTIQADRFLGLNYIEVGISNRVSPVEAGSTAKITGIYVFPKKALKILLNPMSIWKLNYPSLRGALEVVSDPVMQLTKILRESLGKY